MWHKSRVIVCLIVPLLMVAGCGKEKKPRYTAVPITGYPFPFGVSVKRLMGKEAWQPDTLACPHFTSYILRDPLPDSRWADYTYVVVTSDSSGKLQGFSAARAFSTTNDAQAALLDLLGEIRRRYGSPTDSSLVNRTVILARRWRDSDGNMITVEEANEAEKKVSERAGKVWMIHSQSAKLRKDCRQPFLD